MVLKNGKQLSNQATRRVIPSAWATALAVALAVAFAASLSQPAYADKVTPLPVPPDLQVAAGNEAFLVGHAVGTQNYVWAPF
jgi:hypothetical protein